MKKKLFRIISLVLAFLVLFSSGSTAFAKRKKKKNTPALFYDLVSMATPAPEDEAPIIKPQEIADYIFEHGCLPPNFITKQEAKDLGWDSRYNYVSDVAPGKSIGGDYFGNYDGKLPRVKGRKYYEADALYISGSRGAHRIIYSSDGRVWYTKDHYTSFVELFPSK